MVRTSALVGVAIVSLGLVFTPGPTMIHLASRSITQGRRAALVSLLGIFAGFLVFLAAATAGLGAVLVSAPEAFTAIKLAGAAYLLYLAWQAVRPGGKTAFAPSQFPPDAFRRLFLMGLLTNLLNPKAFMLYFALLPQFIDPELNSVPLQSLLLGATQIGVSLSGNGLIVLFAGSLASFLGSRPLLQRIQRYLTGGVLGVFAIRLT
jgi:threonine/homoserine/homoserine lactone efflux protein